MVQKGVSHQVEEWHYIKQRSTEVTKEMNGEKKKTEKWRMVWWQMYSNCKKMKNVTTQWYTEIQE